MTATAFTDAVSAARAVLGDRSATLEPAEDSYERLAFEAKTESPSIVLRLAGDAVRREVIVIVDWERGDSRIRLRTQADDTWTAEGDLENALPHLRVVQPKPTWTTDELLGDGGDRELDAAEEVRVRVEVDKAHWSGPIARETGRTVWIGPSANGFAHWLADSNVAHSVRTLFGSGGGEGRAGALVLLADWQGNDIYAGERLVVGSLNARVQAPEDRSELRHRLAERDELDELPRWRTVDVDRAGVPDPLMAPLTRVVGMTAARLIAEDDVRGRLRPSNEEPTLWLTLPDPPGSDAADVEAIVMLARWLGDDFSQARLDVARHVAAASIRDPLDGGDALRLLETARVTYHLVVHRNVLESLRHQQKLEEAFHTLDDKAEEMRSKLGDTLDATVSKVLGAALALSIAALASAKVRNLPATIAAVTLAGYLVWSAMTLSRWFRKDAESRLDAARMAAAGRLEGVGANLDAIGQTWKMELSRRVTVAIAVMYVLAAILVAGGLVANRDFRRATGIEEGKVTGAAHGVATRHQRTR